MKPARGSCKIHGSKDPASSGTLACVSMGYVVRLARMLQRHTCGPMQQCSSCWLLHDSVSLGGWGRFNDVQLLTGSLAFVHMRLGGGSLWCICWFGQRHCDPSIGNTITTPYSELQSQLLTRATHSMTTPGWSVFPPPSAHRKLTCAKQHSLYGAQTQCLAAYQR
jgi:hypothetical protein